MSARKTPPSVSHPPAGGRADPTLCLNSTSLAPEALITLAQSRASDAIAAANCAGEVPLADPAIDPFVRVDARPSLGQHHFQRSLAALKQIVAVQFNEVEGVEKYALVSAVVTDEINEATPLPSQATALPSMMQERERSRESASTISGKRWVRSLPGRL
jgi:hypothetical protein